MKVWQCPGPMRLLNSIADAIVDGQTAILRTPMLAPDGIGDELRLAMSADGWTLYPLSGETPNPARAVLEACWIDDRLAGEVSAETLLDVDDLSGRIFLCQPGEKASAQRWLDFLAAYALARRARPDADGPRFALSLLGELAELPAPKVVGVNVFDLGDAVGQTDLLLLAYYHAGSTRGTSIREQVIAQTAASIALWDINLLFRLLDESPERLFSPADVLQDYASELGWRKGDLPAWHNGSKRQMGAKEELHSAHAALNDARGVVSSRVWAGQAAVLLPAIEKRRLSIIESQRALLSREIPFKTLYEQVTDVFDLEIGPVWYLLKKWNAPSSVTGQALRMMKARNMLAHMSPLTAEDAFSI